MIESPVIKEFLEATPKWLEEMDGMEKRGGFKDLCPLCGMKPSNIKELHAALSDPLATLTE